MNDRVVFCIEKTSARRVCWIVITPTPTKPWIEASPRHAARHAHPSPRYNRYLKSSASTVLCNPWTAHASPVLFPSILFGVEHRMHLSPVFATTLIMIM
jgi:hypothetical protein